MNQKRPMEYVKELAEKLLMETQKHIKGRPNKRFWEKSLPLQTAIFFDSKGFNSTFFSANHSFSIPKAGKGMDKPFAQLSAEIQHDIELLRSQYGKQKFTAHADFSILYESSNSPNRLGAELMIEFVTPASCLKSDGVLPKKKLIKDLCVVLTYQLAMSEHDNACLVMLNLGPDGKATKLTESEIKSNLQEELSKLTPSLKSEEAQKLVDDWKKMFVIVSPRLQ